MMQVRHAAELVSVALFRHGEKLFRKLKANHSQRLLQQCGKSQQLTAQDSGIPRHGDQLSPSITISEPKT